MRRAARLEAVEQPSNVIPLVAPKRTSNHSVWIAASVLAVIAITLFLVLDARRRAITAPATKLSAERAEGLISAPPDLVIPRVLPSEGDPTMRPPVYRVEGGGAFPLASTAVIARPSMRPAPVPSVYPQSYATPAEPRPMAPYPEVSYAPPPYGATAPSPMPQSGSSEKQAPSAGGDRVFAARLVSPSTTVPLGTVIPAVLETALDSTRAGAVRGIVSRDVRGFDGSRVLIPRGSRLYGEYGSELAPGQRRALIRWSRLVRPDGALIALDSPASDPLGRAGVEGKVDSKFLERFGEALLQSTLDIGTGVAARSIGGGAVVFGLPGGSAPQVSEGSSQQVQRTLTVRQGTSVSVFVARDLDFTPVEN